MQHRTLFLSLLLLIASAVHNAVAVVVTIGALSCSNMSVSINATLEEFQIMPHYLRVAIQDQTQIASLPEFQLPKYGTHVVMNTAAVFGSPFVLSDGSYDVVIDMITSADTNNSIASMVMHNVYFHGCYAANTGTATGTASTATATGPGLTYVSAIGLPTHGITSTSGQDSSTSSGLSSGAKIGITVGVLALALLAVLVAMAFVYRRWQRKQEGPSSKPRRYVNGRWINEEDRNSAELKQISSPIQA